MSKLALLVMLSISGATTFAQERVNSADLVFIKKSEKLTEATGWAMSADGKWFDHKNIMNPNEKPDTIFGYGNFYWLQSASLLYQGQAYYIFMYEDLSGDYRLPSIRQDWYQFHQVYYIIFDRNEYALLKSAVNKKESKTLSINSKINKGDNNEQSYDETDLLKRIQIALARNHQYEQACFYINSQTLKGQDIVRFNLPGSCGILKDEIKDHYFEVPASEFKKLLID